MRRANSHPAASRAGEVTVRRARRSDLAALAALYDQLHVSNYADFRVPPARMARAFERLARARNHSILVAMREGTVVGTCHVIVVAHLGHGLKPFAVVENVVVDEHARSMGIGERLIEAAAKAAARAG